ncbi:hypothetical protein PILCRDRAFT_59930 [Piloderma croceum F 1598]|uniref:Phosphatidic acid phosphatase type 2/haloperoxidase domain-containing protein n=1 Tax=Piloderma croceum (strain F 1598) TaxID=765440 RepID=A0A0C3G1Z5_PILCF|nr:hypothetical protein PILCRDRAFT_59930 [Piloderma croceum F 1598]
MVTGAAGSYRGSLMEVHHGFLAIWSGRGLTRLITEFLKSSVGRLRPDFLARCRWDPAVQACTGNADTILNGRRSFPSGHSSAIFASMTFMSLLFAGKTAAWCYGVSPPHASFRASKLARFSLTLLPFFCAAWVAISRVEDYRHHKEDVIVGSLIGISVSTVCYLMFWPNPFNPRHFTQQRLGRPRLLYTDDDNASRDANFELTRHEDELESV